MKIQVKIALILAAFLFCVRLSIIPALGDDGAAADWGDNGGGRPSYTREEIDSGVLKNSIVFNSISDSSIGDEKNFVGARLDNGGNAGEDEAWIGREIFVQDGDIYLIRLFVNNNSIQGYDGTAQNVTVAFSIPTASSVNIPVYGYIFSDNATPDEYWDSVLFTSNAKFHLEYKYGSALLENQGIGTGGLPLSDEIVTKAYSNHGTPIGYDALDGKIPGGSQYESYVTIRVMVVFDLDFAVEQKVRLAGDTEWRTSIDAEVGDLVEFQTTYSNIGKDIVQSDVMMKVILSENLSYVSGSTKLFNSNHPDGFAVNDADTMSMAQNGVNIGSYLPNSSASVRFTAKVVDNNLQSGSNTLVNWGQSGVGQKSIQDYAAIRVDKAG